MAMSFSGAGGINFTPEYRQKAGFKPMDVSSAGITTDASSGAQMVDATKNFINARENAADWAGMVQGQMINRGKERMANESAKANIFMAGTNAVSTAQQGALKKEALEAQASSITSSAGVGAVAKVFTAGIGLLAGSDETTKFEIENIEDALATLRNLRPVSYRYLEEYGDPDRVHHGFIAQEYQTVLPDATYTNGENGKLCIDTMDLIGILVRAVQELETKVAALEVERVLVAS